ncbi:unnamed protein product [Caenorhabditis brenneri]
MTVFDDYCSFSRHRTPMCSSAIKMFCQHQRLITVDLTHQTTQTTQVIIVHMAQCPNGLVPPHYVISDPMNHQYLQPAPPPYGPVPYGMMVPYPQQSRTLTCTINKDHHTSQIMLVIIEEDVRMETNHQAETRCHGVPVIKDSKAQSSPITLVLSNGMCMKLMTEHITSQIADLEKQIGAALDKAFAPYPSVDAPCGRALGAPTLAVEHLARHQSPMFQKFSRMRNSKAQDYRNLMISPFTFRNLPAATDNDQNETKSSEILTSSFFRDAVLRNRAESSKSIASIRCDVPINGNNWLKGTTLLPSITSFLRYFLIINKAVQQYDVLFRVFHKI